MVLYYLASRWGGTLADGESFGLRQAVRGKVMEKGMREQDERKSSPLEKSDGDERRGRSHKILF